MDNKPEKKKASETCFPFCCKKDFYVAFRFLKEPHGAKLLAALDHKGTVQVIEFM
jgi:hypothetical protein